jgi:hypothetical protein
MTALEARMQVQTGLVWIALLLGAVIFGFYMTSNAPLLILAVAGIGWLGTLPYHGRLCAILGITTYGSALMVPLMPGRPFVWEVAALLGCSGIFVTFALRKYSPEFTLNLRRYRWIVLGAVGYALVLLYLMRTHGLGLRMTGGDRMGGRVYIQQLACSSFPIIFAMIQFPEKTLLRLFTIHLFLSATFILSDLALALGPEMFWVFYVLDLANDAINFEMGSEVTGIRRFQSFSFVAIAMLQLVLILVPLRKIFSSSAIWLVPLLFMIAGLGLPGGHRGVLVLLGGILLIASWSQGIWSVVRITGMSLITAILLAFVYAIGDSLPLAAQRTLAVLPGIQLDSVAVEDARNTLGGRSTMREVGKTLIPYYLWRGRGFGPASEPVPFYGFDQYGTVSEHVNYGRFYNGPIGLMVNTGVPGTLCLLGLIAATTLVSFRILRYCRRNGVEDRFLRFACVNGSTYIVNVFIFLFLHGDSEFAMNTFGLQSGLVLATDWALRSRERNALASAAAKASAASAAGPQKPYRRPSTALMPRPSTA